MPHYAVFCAAHKRRLSAGTGLGAAATAVPSLEQQAKLLSNADLPRNTDAVFLLNRPSPRSVPRCPLGALRQVFQSAMVAKR